MNMTANYDKTPFIAVKGRDNDCHEGWEAVGRVIREKIGQLKGAGVIAIECYPGVRDEEVIPQLTEALPGTFYFTKDAMLAEEKILQLVYPDTTDDEIFGYMTRLELADFFDRDKRRGMRRAMDQATGVIYVYGPGAALIAEQWDLLVYLDMPRWEAQLRFRRKETATLVLSNKNLEASAINLVFAQSRALLGNAVQVRFGDEFAIRFDFLDTMGGGNLSLQVHPTTEYIRENFGMDYTQDESYYILDAEPEAFVYLGLKGEISPAAMVRELEEAQAGDKPFEAEKFVGKWPIKKHDHVLIPAGTVHCSGKNSMMLEISATPYIFTFKLWDWGRMGLDGRPRPINIGHGRKVIHWPLSPVWTT